MNGFIIQLSDYMSYDYAIVLTIIGINMTVIGLTSLAESKNVIGIDYGRFLIKRFKVWGFLRMYDLLIAFAIVNATSLFLGLVVSKSDVILDLATNAYIRIGFLVYLLLSLCFAIYYFFAFIIVENTAVKKQVIEEEMLGLYFKDDNNRHFYIDEDVGLPYGNRSKKKLATNIVCYFDTFSGESQDDFECLFGPDGIIYSDDKRLTKIRRKRYKQVRYPYRELKTGEYLVKDISFEFFQMIRGSKLQHQWYNQILFLMNGDLDRQQVYNKIAMSNIARVFAHAVHFDECPTLYNHNVFWKFIGHVFWAVDATNWQGTDEEKAAYKQMEYYAIREFSKYMMVAYAKNSTAQFRYEMEKFINPVLSRTGYKGLLGFDDRKGLCDEFVVAKLDGDDPMRGYIEGVLRSGEETVVGEVV